MSVTLDSQQLRAASLEGSSLVIAGPGSGKTRLLTEKAKTLRNGVALTFTRSAAQEIRNRAPEIYACTIHSLCYHTVGRILSYDILLDEFLERKHKPQFLNVLVDECQDLTEKELAVVRSLLTPKSKIMFVGDTHQSIFGYQGALGIEIKEAIRDKFGKIGISYLSNNYRSTPDIVRRLESIYYRGLKGLGNESISGMAILARTNKQIAMIAEELRERNPNLNLRVILRGDKYPGAAMEDREVEEEITLCNIHIAKGREWEKVIYWNWGEATREKNLLYVACSRASQDFSEAKGIDEVYRLVQEWTKLCHTAST